MHGKGLKHNAKNQKSLHRGGFFDKLVGTAGFEPATTTPPVWCATRLRYAPIQGGQSYTRKVLLQLNKSKF